MDPPTTATAIASGDEPLRKRQKLSESLKKEEDGEKTQNGAAAASTEKKQAMLLDISDNGALSTVFEFVGSQGIAQCMLVCRSWAAAAKGNPSLWRNFAKREFRFSVPDDTTSSSTNNSSSIQQQSVTTPTNWPTAYRYLARHYRRSKSWPPEESPNPLSGRVVFADDGGHFPGYPAKYALSPRNLLVWCTSPGVERNVDLVVELDAPSIITGFVIANGGRGYSAPLKEGLAFVSMDPPDLEAARFYDDDNGRSWVKKLLEKGDRKVSAANAKSCPSGTVPLAAVRFSILPDAFDASAKIKFRTPIVGRYIHFKLLSSHFSQGYEGFNDNIDIMHCHTMGVPVGDLDLFVPSIAKVKPIPAYKPIHAIRPPAFDLQDREAAENQPLFVMDHHIPNQFDDDDDDDDN